MEIEPSIVSSPAEQPSPILTPLSHHKLSFAKNVMIKLQKIEYLNTKVSSSLGERLKLIFAKTGHGKCRVITDCSEVFIE